MDTFLDDYIYLRLVRGHTPANAWEYASAIARGEANETYLSEARDR